MVEMKLYHNQNTFSAYFFTKASCAHFNKKIQEGHWEHEWKLQNY